MNHEATLIFPHQLFENNSLVLRDRRSYIIEDQRYFTDFSFHKHKLMLHRASMQAYYNNLKKQYDAHYIVFSDAPKLFDLLMQREIVKVHYFDPVDLVLEKRLAKEAQRTGIELCSYETPMFLSEQKWLNDYYANPKKSFFMASFYKDQRTRLDILMMPNGKPVGGSWSYDVDNRLKIPSGIAIPSLAQRKQTIYTNEAAQYVDRNFSDNPGTTDTFWFATTHDDAKRWFDDFLKKRLVRFGPYEDAIVSDEVVLFHSVLSPYLNCGLLTPDYVINKTVVYSEKHNVPLNSVEGFIRQIIGWREFIRAIYVFKGDQERSSNFWQHKRALPSSLWNATTEIEPVDSSIAKLLNYSYLHHIERLMILGNFMLLCQFNPNDVYAWFMELFIDAYDWVMVPNVYGMSQYADGGLFATKPYISSSNYLLKMSDFKKGPWCQTWDALYWHFIYKHKDYFSSQGRLAVMNYQLKRMGSKTLQSHIQRAEDFLKNI